MSPFTYVAVFALVAVAVVAQEYEYEARPAPQRVNPSYSGPSAPKPTPVAILKQINRHNEDGSYTYGYEGGDGSFKIETKLATGEVKGKYGYVDDTGKVRVVEYGATKYGFEPSGEGITVAPPTLVDETTNKDGTQNAEYAQYDEPAPRPQQHIPRPRPASPAASYEFNAQPQFAPQPQYAPQPQFAPARSAPPAPPRAQIAGAIPSNFDFVPQRPIPARSFGPAVTRAYAPAPIQEETYEQPAPRPSPKITYAQPRPAQQQFQFAPSPQATQAFSRPQPQPQPQQSYARPQGLSGQGRPSGGVLDQLAKDYALPEGGSPALHDISFGYY